MKGTVFAARRPLIQNMCCENSAEYVLPRGQESKVWGTARRIIMDSKKGVVGG
jgi:hypothetical protein